MWCTGVDNPGADPKEEVGRKVAFFSLYTVWRII